MPNPTGDELALLKAVAAAPADDLPRLVYADWLEERGRTERAEFIRLQIEEELRPHWSVRERLKAFAEGQAIFLRELPKWVRAWYADHPWHKLQFQRGFVEELNVYASPFLQFGDRLLDRTPLTRLTLYHVRGLRGRLDRCEWLGRVPYLNLAYERLGSEGAASLAANRRLDGIHELDLEGCDLGDAGVRALVDATSLSGLRILDLRGNRLSLAAVKALRGASFVRGLERLNLAENPQLMSHQWRIQDWFGGRVVLDD